jgi:hypothetical protein
MLDCGPSSNIGNLHKACGFHIENVYIYTGSSTLGLSTGAFLYKYHQNDAKG